MARPRPSGGHIHVPVAIAVAAVLLSSLRPAAAQTEAEVLVAFRDTLRGPDGAPPGPLRNWGTPGPCRGNSSSWYGVSCHGNGTVQGLQLERLGLAGAAPDLAALAVLPGLRALSLSDNALTGAFPNVSALAVLKMLYLSRNRLSGVIPEGTFGPMRGLRKLHLAFNEFSGPVPGSITSPRLLELSLANNRFEGPLPDFSQPELRFVDVSNNNLSGPIPAGLNRFNSSMFAGNKFLCGKPLDVECDGTGAPRTGMSTMMKIAIALIVLGVILCTVGIATGVLGRRRKPRRRATSETLGSGDQMPSNPTLKTAPAVNIENAASTSHPRAGAAGAAGGAAAAKRQRRDEHGRLVFIQEGRTRFEIEDLLRASAEVLGSGNFGSSYKATLCEGPAVVVKRFKDMNGVGREDFSEHMRRLGRLAHPNLLPLVAYLYKKEEKLLVTDYVVNGSLAQLLHGNRGSLLDWGKRLRIIKGAARGLSHLYDELPMLTVPHGHLKSSNVLLDGAFEAVLSDYALVPVVTSQIAAQVMVAYKAPECIAPHGKPSKKSDVWSLGILILEVLTGKFPANYLRQGRQSTDLAGWVQSVVTEERTSEVFDKDITGARGYEADMVKLLQVGLGCCDADVDRRLDLKAVIARIDEIREPEPAADSPSSS
ncbi:putative LRR receptor-like serine/threonine-protein kinase [Dichanthelium oligosanthes]|uniref:Putative LRR receptor-like serine/threonine-protein kinase n=1 Tax=Dichanthelium oligosanthes TaxID=888268 RepID=A0A1E5WCY1_9POAL|nr:putative LRR receptor-like serine/threonine-protein kinase [Dichanthelium oligosanthes]